MVGLSDTNMTYYVIQVKTGGEEKFLQAAVRQLGKEEMKICWPRRKLRIRKQGVWRDSQAPIFLGYLFLQTETVTPELYWGVKRVPGFFRFLKDNQHIEPLSGRDQEILTHFLSFGEIVDRSLVILDENKRISVIEGPLKGLEGRIVKVDKRKGRARVRLDFYEDSFLIDFGFEFIKPLEQPAGETGKKKRKAYVPRKS